MGSLQLLLAAYSLGVAGTLWDWREHFLGFSVQAPHLVIDVGALLAIGVLGFSDWRRLSNSSFAVIYALLVLVMLIALGPFLLMMTAPHSQLMAFFMRWEMTRGALLLELPIVLLAGWAAWRWLRLGPINTWRSTAAIGVVVVAVGSVWDLYWHQTHAMELGATMNMMTLPPHQLILGGFVLGLIGSAAGLAVAVRRSSQAEPLHT
ncbi:MAG TPA: hypothetical protein VGX27_10675 [Candidatus Dormibacteraeota bacterium]|nr:hypothetical protein [Candidatus Dormibacteraeota bacterium]